MKIYIGDTPNSNFKLYCNSHLISKLYLNNALIYEENYIVYKDLNACVMGDSTIAIYAGQNSVAYYFDELTPLNLIATPGDTILGQTTKFNNSSVDHAQYDVVIIQIGLNDLTPSSSISTSQTITNYQTMINTVRSKINPAAKIYIGKMLPCKQRLIDVYGEESGLLSQQRWLDINNAIMNTITGVDGRIDSHVPLLDDGNSNLKAAYDTGDHIHENAAGRQVIATAWRDKLIADNVLTP